MNAEERQRRIWNMNAHFVWALAAWGSAEDAEPTSPILAAVGYYYAAFHAGYATGCTDSRVTEDKFERVDHGTVHSWISALLGAEASRHFRRLQHLRNTLNYLGVGGPLNKFLLVQGRPVPFRLEDGTTNSFADALAESRLTSRSVLYEALAHIERHCATEKWPGPKRGDDYWQVEYLQDDLLLSVFPTDEARRRTLARGFGLLRAT